MNNLAELLDIAQRAVDIGHHHMTTGSAGKISEKADRDLVTELDVTIQHEIRDFLQRETPDIEFLGEEDGGGTLDENTDYTWVLDPIDGTSNFAHGIPLCATSLALVHHGQPIVGVINAPFLGLRYHAVHDSRAYCNGEPIHASETSELRHAIVSLGDYATGPDAAEKNQRRFAVTQALAARVERVRMFGSAALDLAWVAHGRTDACIILSNKPWDMSAGVLIARESGASVTDASGQSYGLRSPETIAANKTAHMLSALLDKTNR